MEKIVCWEQGLLSGIGEKALCVGNLFFMAIFRKQQIPDDFYRILFFLAEKLILFNIASIFLS